MELSRLAKYILATAFATAAVVMLSACPAVGVDPTKDKNKDQGKAPVRVAVTTIRPNPRRRRSPTWALPWLTTPKR